MFLFIFFSPITHHSTPLFTHAHTLSLPLWDYMETVAMAQFKEVTGHEMNDYGFPGLIPLSFLQIKYKDTQGVFVYLYFFFHHLLSRNVSTPQIDAREMLTL